MKPVWGSLTMIVAFCGWYCSAIFASSSSTMCWTVASMESDTLNPSTAGTSRVRNCASSRLLPSFSDSSQPFSPLR